MPSNQQSFVSTLQIFIKLYLCNIVRHFVDKLVLHRVVVYIYFRVTGFQSDRHVTYSERRARSEWKLYQVRLRCVKGARISISKDRLPIDAGANAYLVTNRKRLCNSFRIGSFIVAFLREGLYRSNTGIITLAKNVQMKYSCP